MANIRLTIQHGNVIYEPPIEEGVQIEWERLGTPGKLTFTTVKVEGLAFQEGDKVCFYCDDKLVFVGYVFTKSRDKEHRIKVTCYDQVRYLKNKFTYVFENKTATQIVKSLCNDFNLNIGDLDNTAYVIPALVEENKSALDIILSVLDETLVNTGKMYVLYDDCGSIRIRDAENMMSTTLIYEESAENFDYSSSIDDETYNNIVLYYDPNSNNSGSSSGSSGIGTAITDADKIVEMAKSQLGTKESPSGSNKVKYNTEYYGSAISGSGYAWCCVFVWWVFKQCGLSNLFYDGEKVAYCPSAVSWFKQKGQWVTSGYQPGDVIFFDWNGNGASDHVGIVESVDGNKVTCIEGNYSDSVARVVRTGCILGAGRPAYSSKARATDNTTSGSNPNVTVVGNGKGVQIFTASSPSTIKQWGILRYFEKVNTPSAGQNKANALLKLYNRKTRELKMTGAFGDISVRGGTLIPVKLYLGDISANNFMLVEKVTHKFTKDHHTMDLTLEGEWDDTDTTDTVSHTFMLNGTETTNNSSSTSSGQGGGYTSNSSSSSKVQSNTSTGLKKYTISIGVIGGMEFGDHFGVVYTKDGKQVSETKSKNGFSIIADTGTDVKVVAFPKNNCGFDITGRNGSWKVNGNQFRLTVKEPSSIYVKWTGKSRGGAGGKT